MKLILLILLLVACDGTEPTELLAYKCSPEMMKVVERQSLWCKENTNYLGTYCYLSAMDRNCPKSVDKIRGEK